MTVEAEAPDLAEAIMTQLGQDFTLPAVDLTGAEFQLPSDVGNALYSDIVAPTIATLTEALVGGTGTYDVIMTSNRVHLKDQYDKGLITGDQYTKAYIELSASALAAGLQMVLTGEQNHWAAVMAQLQARRAEIESVTAAVALETAKAQLATANRQAELINAQYVQTVMQLPEQQMKYELAHAQVHLVEYQALAARGQTYDVQEDDFTPIVGSVGKQRELYTQQISSYQRDTEQKVAKMYLDAWITGKTLDENLATPAELVNAEIDGVIANLRTAAGLD